MGADQNLASGAETDDLNFDWNSCVYAIWGYFP
jgi:hypothetical protein